jgi:hypothetical protein
MLAVLDGMGLKFVKIGVSDNGAETSIQSKYFV